MSDMNDVRDEQEILPDWIDDPAPYEVLENTPGETSDTATENTPGESSDTVTAKNPEEKTEEGVVEVSAEDEELATKSKEDKPEIPEMKRKPYHERYYMLYGGDKVPESINPSATLGFLKGMGLGDNPLQQAREGKDMAARIESAAYEQTPGKHFCDFCGVQLTGVSYDVLKDGRERCTSCTRTAVKTASQFETMFREVISNMELFFNIRIGRDIRVEMVNSKTLHKRLGETFTPTGEVDARILGVAIKDKKGRYTVLVENGAPRLEAIKTMVHELTHIWQYQNWNAAQIKALYGEFQEIRIYEGMAKWVEVQYCFLLGESGVAKKEELLLENRNDEYGIGFLNYRENYPLSYDSECSGDSPFDNLEQPL